MRRLLVCTVIGILLLASAPSDAAASGRGAAVPAAGVWSWVNTAWIPGRTIGTCPSCIDFATGSEASTWTGTFAGTSTDTFKVAMSGGGAMAATLAISFVGSVNGADGTLRMFATAWAAPGGTMTGTWTVLGGTGRLSGVHGEGTWIYTGTPAGDTADYSGLVTLPRG
jgi:hypothetical protein